MIRLIACVLTLFAVAFPAWSQSWPTRPIKIIAPFAPGGGVDIAARLVASKLQELLGQPVIVENKPGGGTMIGADIVAKAPPDGYTLLLTSNSLVNSPTLFGRAPFDWRKDFAFVTTILEQPMVLEVNLDLPVRNVSDLVELAKKPGSKLSFGTPGAGSLNHLAGEWLAQLTGAKWEMVHYKGMAQSNPDLINGTIQLQFDQIGAALPLLRSGKLRPIAVTTAKRSAAAPEIPTVAETLPGFEATTWFAMFAPAGTPRPIIDKLNAEAVRIFKLPDVQERLQKLGLEPVLSSPDELTRYQAAEIAKWTKVVKDSGASAE